MARHEFVKGLPVVMVAEGKQVDKVDDNHTDRHEHDRHDKDEPKGAWFGLRIGVLIGGLAGTLIGGLVGSVAMLLLAPHSGKKTRAKLLRQGKELREQTAETAEDAMDGRRQSPPGHARRTQAG